MKTTPEYPRIPGKQASRHAQFELEIWREHGNIACIMSARKSKAHPQQRRRPRKRPATVCKPTPMSSVRTNGGLTKVDLSEHIVADPAVCHGKLTFKGTRIMVWQILQDREYGETMEEIVKAWGGRVTKDMIVETLRLAHSALLDEHGHLIRTGKSRLAA